MLRQIKTKQNSQLTKVGAAVAGALVTLKQTFCVDLNATLNKTTDLIFTLLNWGGIIITVMGVVMIGKAVMDASSGQGHADGLGKAIGVLALGVIMLAAKSVLTILGVQSTI